MQVDAIYVLTDSQLVAEQLSDGYEAREPTMVKYLAKVQEMLRFKRDGIFPTDEASAQRIRRTQAWYSEVNGRLYKRSFSHPLLWCLGPEEAHTVLAEDHEGICGEHIAGHTLAYKILRQGAIVTDNRSQFASTRFREFCASYGIQLMFTSVAHPQTNGLAEVTNRSILDGLRRRVTAAQSAWVEELPSILWSLRTTSKIMTGESPYSLSYGTEAILPPEVVFPTPQAEKYDEEASARGLRAGLDLIEERRADAHLKDLSYKRAVARIYNRKVRPRPIKLGDLVLRRIEVGDPTRTHDKLVANWEGPYRVIDVVRLRTYRLATTEGCPLPRTWNVRNLKKFFV
uniref:Integrase catalytic domain-containing protein n=1 Tax=Musa acuminata subsp. malaccensis TaxID=214687 RepID=A0A804JFN3_MUSAM